MVNGGRNPGLGLGIAAGLAAAFVAAVLWSVVVEVTGYELGFAAIGVGLLVGQAMALTARTSRGLPVAAATLALLGCLLGNLFVDAHEVAKILGAGTPSTLWTMLTHPDLLVTVLKAGFSPFSLAFWALAAVAGYRLAARRAGEVAPQPIGRAVAGPTFTGRLPDQPVAPAVPGAPPLVARHPSDFFSQPSAPRHTPQARQAAFADQGLLQSLPKRD